MVTKSGQEIPFSALQTHNILKAEISIT